jgi:hypothetical protein
MPGVNVSTAARSGPSSALTDFSGQFFVVGMADRGPTDVATLIRGLADFEAIFGTRVSYSTLYDTVKTFFEEGGDQAYVVRVVGDAASIGKVTINDRAGTPVPTLDANAASAGAWSSNLKVIVDDGSLANTVKVTITLNNSQVESYDNLDSPASIVTRFANSLYVNFVNKGSATVAPANNPEVGTYTITAGTDDRATVDADSYTAGLALFTEGLGDGAVSVPGVGTTVHAALQAHAIQFNRIAILSMLSTSIESDLTTQASALDTEYAGLFAPWVQISDGAGGVRNVPPDGYVAACRARAHKQTGAWRAPAGGIAVANTLVGLSTEFTTDQANNLDSAKVSVIRRVANTIRLYGWRSLSNDTVNWSYLNFRDLMNRLVVESENRLEGYVFSPVDAKGALQAAINAELVGIVEPIRQAGGLWENVGPDGTLIDPGYLVETGSSVNTSASLANNEVRARLSVRMSPVSALVSLTIVKVGLLSGF